MKHFAFSEGGEGGGDTSIVRQEEIDRISRKLATLEMKVYRDTYRLCLAVFGCVLVTQPIPLCGAR